MVSKYDSTNGSWEVDTDNLLGLQFTQNESTCTIKPSYDSTTALDQIQTFKLRLKVYDGKTEWQIEKELNVRNTDRPTTITIGPADVGHEDYFVLQEGENRELTFSFSDADGDASLGMFVFSSGTQHLHYQYDFQSGQDQFSSDFPDWFQWTDADDNVITSTNAQNGSYKLKFNLEDQTDIAGAQLATFELIVDINSGRDIIEITRHFKIINKNEVPTLTWNSLAKDNHYYAVEGDEEWHSSISTQGFILDANDDVDDLQNGGLEWKVDISGGSSNALSAEVTPPNQDNQSELKITGIVDGTSGTYAVSVNVKDSAHSDESPSVSTTPLTFQLYIES